MLISNIDKVYGYLVEKMYRVCEISFLPRWKKGLCGQIRLLEWESWIFLTNSLQ
jgi:hypothetical protein